MEERTITLSLAQAKEFYKKGGILKTIALTAFKECELNPSLPQSWEEFCDNYPMRVGECYIDNDSSALVFTETSIIDSDRRDDESDRNVLPSEKDANAHLALMQLHQLRDCYRQGWEPDWNGGLERYSIMPKGNDYYSIELNFGYCRFLTFPTRALAHKFMDNFFDLINTARELL